MWLAKAIGDDRMLKRDDGGFYDPHVQWFAMLLDRIEGKTPVTLEVSEPADPIASETADAMIQAGLKAKGVSDGPDS